MHWRLAIAAALLPLLEARQHILSLKSEAQSLLPQHDQPWSVLLKRDPSSMDCVILSAIEETQVHRAIQEPGDTLVVNKNLLNTGANPLQDSIMEILAYDKRSLWAKVSEMCSGIEYQLPPEIESFADYEVVRSSIVGANFRKNCITQEVP
jgi:hypothetical protein